LWSAAGYPEASLFSILFPLSITPRLIRATGIGWVDSIGRIGAILSPIVGEWIIKTQVAPFSVLGMLVVSVAMCAVGVQMFRSIFQTSSAK
jgi:hypothetical protein